MINERAGHSDGMATTILLNIRNYVDFIEL